MDTNQLRSFAVLAEELHFTRAAKRLGVSQSALSQLISKMEEEIGVALFSRTQRKVQLTAPGALFLSEALELNRSFDRAVDLAKRLAKGEVGLLRIGFVENASFNVLSGAVSTFRKANPEVSVELHEMISLELIDALKKEKLDVAFLRPIVEDDEIESRLVVREPYYIALPEEHPLAQREVIHLQEVKDLPFIGATGTKIRYLKMQFAPLFKKLGMDFTIGQGASQLPSIMALVGAGTGFTLLPKSTTGLRVPGVEYRPIANADAPLAELIIAHKCGDNSPLVRLFLKNLNTNNPKWNAK